MTEKRCEMNKQELPQGPDPVSSSVIDLQTEVSVPDHLIWSAFNFFFMNFCCLGFLAFAYSVMSRDRKLAGDIIGAKNYSSTAKILNISALILGFIFNVAVVVGVIYFCNYMYKIYVQNSLNNKRS